MSDHKIVGGCSTLLAKSNKKMHFSRPRSCVYQKNVVPLQPKTYNRLYINQNKVYNELYKLWYIMYSVLCSGYFSFRSNYWD